MRKGGNIIFSVTQGQLHSHFMVVSLTCKNEEVPIKNEGARVIFSPLVDTSFFQSLKGSSIETCGIWPKFELILTLMYVLISCKNEKDQIKQVAQRATIAQLRASMSL